MRTTKKITLSAIIVALSAVLLMIGGIVGVAELLMETVASLLVVFVYIEIGSPYTWFVWLGTTLATFFMPNGTFIAGVYFLVFGIWPILKALVERTPRFLWLILKLVYVNAVTAVLVLLSELLTGAPFFTTTLWYLIVGIVVLINVAFIAYDAFLTVMVRLYFAKYRKLFSKLLK